MNKKIYALLVAVLSGVMLYGQVGQGTLSGKIVDKETGEPLPFVNVAVYKGSQQIKGTTSDFDGKYTIKPLEPGEYDVQATFVGYTPYRVNGVVVRANVITFQDLKMTSGLELEEVEIVQYTKPLIQKDGGASGGSVTSEEISKMPQRSAQGVATTIGGVSTAGTGGGVSIRGSRTDGDFVYIDGVKVRGSQNLPKSALQEVSVITGGVPANYGDATGGIISITTRGPASTFNAGVELITSGFKVGDQRVNLLDKFGQTIMEGTISGPLIRRRKEDGSKGEPLVGYRLSANYTNSLDGRLSAIGHNVITDAAKQQLINDPLRRDQTNEAGAVDYNAQFLRDENFENLAASRNTVEKDVSLQSKLTFDLGNNMDLSVGGRLAYQRDRVYSLGNQFINYEQNPLRTNNDYQTYVRFSQRFLDGEDQDATVSNVYYSVMLDYTRRTGRIEHEEHKDDFFSYGYNGIYTIDKDTFIFEDNARVGFDADSNQILYFRQAAVASDTLVQYQRDLRNENMSNYVDAYFNLFDSPNGSYERLSQMIGFRNGDGPNQVYGRFANLGMPTTAYQKIDEQQFRLTASGSADIGDHAVVLGMEYEQRIDRNWRLSRLVSDNSDRQNDIWSVMRSRMNAHISELDEDSTLLFIDSTYYAYFGRNFDEGSQSVFDRNLRTALGYNPNGTDFINIDALDPSVFSVDYFSADELLNNGVRLVEHRGYDVYGNKTSGTTNVNDYFTSVDPVTGAFTRPIGSFQPVYAAGYIMDKFQLDDIIFNIGVRVDRFDANQPVLKDPYLFRDAYTVGELQQLGASFGLSSEEISNIPGSIGDDFTVYVDDIDNPNQILGYRSDNTFFNSQGQIVNPDLIKAPNGQIAPLLKDRNNTDDFVGPDGFEDYTPQINVMPRIAFSFPISDVAVFFAHYDILTRRPFSSNILDLPRYQFINSISSSAGNPISNPNLMPEKTIDYAFGFQQAVTKSSALKIEAFYREMRDQIQVFQFVGAYPQDYFSFGNLDFGTVKGLTIEYDLRPTGNIAMNVNYTLQFADGTGSSAGGQAVDLSATDFSTLRIISPLNFDQRHKFNARVDFRYGEGKNYNGPVVGGKDILSNFGVNAVFNVGSGTPYSASSNPVNRRLNGTINGSRLPWFYTIDLSIDKNFTISGKKVSDDQPGNEVNMNVFLLVNNLLNTRNIVGVYPTTGNPDDNGYLSDPRFQAEINRQDDVQSYRDIYALSLLTPGAYGAPRTVQLGVRLDF